MIKLFFELKILVSPISILVYSFIGYLKSDVLQDVLVRLLSYFFIR